MESLDALPVLMQQVNGLHTELADVRLQVERMSRDTAVMRADLEASRVRGGTADDAIARLFGDVEAVGATLAELDSGLDESRRLSLRVAQMTDLVFDRLVASHDGADRP